MADVSFDIMGEEKVAKRIGELAGEFGVSIRFICMEQMKLFARDVIKKTGGDPSISLAGQRKAGNSAVESDINQLFISEDDLDWVKDYKDGYAKVKGHTGAVFLARSDERSMGKDDLLSYHEKNRNSMGRTRKAMNYKYNGLTASPKYVVKGRVLKQVIKERQSHVGRLKAGWVRALEELEVKTGGRKVSGVPIWIRKQAPNAPQSGLIDNRSDKNVVLRADNKVAYSGRVIKQSDVDAIGRTREKDLFGSMRKRMDQVVERYNKTKG